MARLEGLATVTEAAVDFVGAAGPPAEAEAEAEAEAAEAEAAEAAEGVNGGTKAISYWWESHGADELLAKRLMSFSTSARGVCQHTVAFLVFSEEIADRASEAQFSAGIPFGGGVTKADSLAASGMTGSAFVAPGAVFPASKGDDVLAAASASALLVCSSSLPVVEEQALDDLLAPCFCKSSSKVAKAMVLPIAASPLFVLSLGCME
mmetsp:Transcript_52534/g.111967  ORF Transcript_52534/g.111967 Transcript_52534/m.111967 type:complete len:207 (-) Transcript_52534:1335-1955(-)